MTPDNLIMLFLRERRNYQTLAEQHQILQHQLHQQRQQQLQQQHNQRVQLPRHHLHSEQQRSVQPELSEPENKRLKSDDKLHHDNEVGILLQNLCFQCFQVVHENQHKYHSCTNKTGSKKNTRMNMLKNLENFINLLLPDENDRNILFQLGLWDRMKDSHELKDITLKSGQFSKIEYSGKRLKGIKKSFFLLSSDFEPETPRMYTHKDLQKMVAVQNVPMTDRKLKKIQQLMRQSKTIRIAPYAFDLFIADRKVLQENFILSELSLNQA